MSSVGFTAESILPWHIGAAEDRRFKKILFHCIGVFLMVALMLPWLPAPVSEQPVTEKKRQEYTRLVIEERKLTPPAPVVEKPKVVAKPEPIVQKKKKPKPLIKPVEKTQAKPKTKPVDLMKQARDKAARTGVLAFADDLAAMRQDIDVSSVRKSNLSRGAAQAKKTERKLLASKATAAVGGISSAALSRDTGGVALSARETTLIDAPTGLAVGAADQAAASDVADYSGRSSESVRRVMDANKGAVFAIYNRALRSDPTLSGKLLFNMVIEPSGAISAIKLVSSEVADQALVKKILARIKLINFGGEPVGQTDVNYSFDFLPY